MDPTLALGHTNEKFMRRFKDMEKHIAEQVKELSSLTLEEWDNLWDKVK